MTFALRNGPSGPQSPSGVATLSGGYISVAQPVKIDEQVVMTRIYATDVTNWGTLGVIVATDRLSFAVKSTNAQDAGSVAWVVV